MLGTKHLLLILLLGGLACPAVAAAQNCTASDRVCILKSMETEAAKIENASWRDQTYRELAKTYAADGNTDKAIALIDKIQTTDTKAMTIRGIGMAAADRRLSQEAYSKLFLALREKANSITHPPSFAIALTYIAMAQAFAGDNEGAWKTASEMENGALRHKAYGETAEIQAERKDFTSAMKSIEFIDDNSYRNKSYATVCKLLADRALYSEALQSADKITNPYQKTESLLYILDKQKPREQPKDD